MVKPVHFFMARNRVSKSRFKGWALFPSLCAFCLYSDIYVYIVYIYIYIYIYIYCIFENVLRIAGIFWLNIIRIHFKHCLILQICPSSTLKKVFKHFLLSSSNLILAWSLAPSTCLFSNWYSLPYKFSLIFLISGLIFFCRIFWYFLEW